MSVSIANSEYMTRFGILLFFDSFCNENLPFFVYSFLCPKNLKIRKNITKMMIIMVMMMMLMVIMMMMIIIVVIIIIITIMMQEVLRNTAVLATRLGRRGRGGY